MVHCRNSSDHEGFVNVVNVVTKEMKKIADSMALLELANVVLTSTALDKSRGNRCIDVGFASDLSTKRDDSDEWGGARSAQSPQTFQVTYFHPGPRWHVEYD